MWIHRTLEPLLQEPSRGLDLAPVWLLLGPRQVGKSSTLRRLAGPDRQIINLDDLATRIQVRTDPVGFSRGLSDSLLIDEIQYAPELLTVVKRIVDEARYSGREQPGMVWITGSHEQAIVRGVQETLAGRVAVVRMFGLSFDELRPESVSKPSDFFQYMINTSFPALVNVRDPITRANYLSGYVATYLERDLGEVVGLIRRREFEVLLKATALRTAQEANFTRLATESGVSTKTVQAWIGILAGSGIVALIPPWHSNRNKRLVKSPKLHYLDAGLAAHLAGWSDPEQWRLGPLGGAAFESYVVGEAIRYFSHRGLPVQLSHLRSSDGREIDLIVEFLGRTLAIEVKLGQPKPSELTRPKIFFGATAKAIVVSLANVAHSDVPIGEEWVMIGPDRLHLYLDDWTSYSHDTP